MWILFVMGMSYETIDIEFQEFHNEDSCKRTAAAITSIHKPNPQRMELDAGCFYDEREGD